jgi:hypothetical protein
MMMSCSIPIDIAISASNNVPGAQLYISSNKDIHTRPAGPGAGTMMSVAVAVEISSLLIWGSPARAAHEKQHEYQVHLRANEDSRQGSRVRASRDSDIKPSEYNF